LLCLLGPHKCRLRANPTLGPLVRSPVLEHIIKLNIEILLQILMKLAYFVVLENFVLDPETSNNKLQPTWLFKSFQM